jgi:hypothetical protein
MDVSSVQALSAYVSIAGDSSTPQTALGMTGKSHPLSTLSHDKMGEGIRGAEGRLTLIDSF